MLYPLLSTYMGFPLLGYLLNALYFGLTIAGILVAGTLFFRVMARAGYEKKRLRALGVCSAIMLFPLGVVSSRAANMFYFPPETWSASFFIEQLFSGPHLTFHASLVLPLLFLLGLGRWLKFGTLHLMDSLFLCIPLGHAVGRLGCLLVGCCWGHWVTFSLGGIQVSFHNPVPLYSIALNLALFSFLRREYRLVYGPHCRIKSQGRIASLYLVGYGVFRILLETIRTEAVVGMNMTLAQWSMIGFILLGVMLGIATSWFPRYAK